MRDDSKAVHQLECEEAHGTALENLSVCHNKSQMKTQTPTVLRASFLFCRKQHRGLWSHLVWVFPGDLILCYNNSIKWLMSIKKTLTQMFRNRAVIVCWVTSNGFDRILTLTETGFVNPKWRLDFLFLYQKHANK